MLRRIAAIGVASVTFVGALAVAPAATADPETVPNGPWVEDSQHVSLERLHDYDELSRTLAKIEHTSHGRVTVEVAGRSNEGRNIYLARAGSGDTTLLYVAQQHGNEPLTSEAALQFLQRVATGGSDVERWLDEVTLLVMPRINLDGAERYWRHNYDPDCTGALYGGRYCRAGQGFDINRYHAPGLTPEANPVPEAAAVQRVFRTHRPDLVVDFHHQGTYVNDEGEMIKTSVFWPIAEGVPADAVDLSKQTARMMYDTLEQYGFAEVSQYPGSTFEGIFRNAYGLRGAGSVLVELRGGIGQKSSGMLMRTAYAGMFGVLEAAAEGTLYEVDPAAADAIPLRGDFVTDPH